MGAILKVALRLKQMATPGNPASGENKVYTKSDDKLYILTSAGTETLVGPAAAATANTMVEQACTSNVTSTNTTPSTITGMSISVTSTSTLDIFEVEIDADVTIATAGTINIIKLLVDGVAHSSGRTLRTFLSGTGAVAGHKGWKVTGLSAGSHTFTATSENSAASTNAVVNATVTNMTVKRIA